MLYSTARQCEHILSFVMVLITYIMYADVPHEILVARFVLPFSSVAVYY
jgi:hypothetical protein